MAETLTPLAKLVKQLATDPKALKRFRENPDAALTAAGLTPVEEDAMKRKDPGLIREALGGNQTGAQMGMFVVHNAIVIII